MIEKPMDILQLFPVRKSKKQKAAFADAIRQYAQAQGYLCALEKGSFGACNIVIGDPKTARHLITAHYDTCAMMPFPNLLTPCSFPVFALYQIAITLLILALAWLLASPCIYFLPERVIGYFLFAIFAYVFIFLMLFGPANRHNANDNTSGVVTALQIARQLPVEQRKDVCFVLFDLEEAGLIGSGSYRKKHKKETDRQVIWNLDCVGDGDEILLFPSKNILKDPSMDRLVSGAGGTYGDKTVTVLKKGFRFCPSDHKNFPLGIGVAAFRRGFLGLYVARIHTPRDKILDKENVNTLCRVLLRAITTGEAS